MSTPKLLAIAAALLLAGQAQAAGEFYCCQDPQSGRRVCGDSVPDACRGRGFKIFDRGGNLLKEVGPPLTPEQKAAKAEEELRRKQEEAAAKEQRRKDQALLDTYATPEDIDMAQKKAEGDVTLSIREAQTRLDGIRKKHAKIANEAEFYKKKTMPPELQKDLRAAEHEMQVQQELIDAKKKEFDAIHGRYDADRKRYTELTGRRSTTAAPSGTAAPR
ncbi:MAG: hypothetical protein PHD19_02250 [Dechloromonas sp.]|uniref:hypothetical protein n=1 Tax=Azonexus sp. TaxID=1872668 RepID=UPI0035B4D296|nr:hypothetical protein [Dechloromonas sp.]